MVNTVYYKCLKHINCILIKFCSPLLGFIAINAVRFKNEKGSQDINILNISKEYFKINESKTHLIYPSFLPLGPLLLVMTSYWSSLGIGPLAIKSLY